MYAQHAEIDAIASSMSADMFRWPDVRRNTTGCRARAPGKYRAGRVHVNDHHSTPIALGPAAAA
jgi:hypothetical protein